MKRWHFLALLFQFFLLGLLSPQNAHSQQPQDPKVSGSFAFTEVNIIPMDQEQVLKNQTLVVENGKISQMGPADEVQIPEQARRIPARDHYLIPGMTEMHGHIPGPEDPGYVKDVLFLFLANGVTTVRNMAGQRYHLELRKKVLEDHLASPRIIAAGPWLSSERVPDPESADLVVREQKAAGFDLLKLGSISREAYLQMARTAHEVEMPFAGHIPQEVGLSLALEAGQRSIDHLDKYVEFLVPENYRSREGGFFGSGIIGWVNEERIPEAIALTLEAGTWNVPTLSLVEHLASQESPDAMIQRPEMRYMPREIRESWARAKREFNSRPDFQPPARDSLVRLRQILTRELYKAGAPMAMGSDAPQFFNVPGFSIHHEMQMMQACGLTPFEVLETATRKPAEYFQRPGESGTIAKGRVADLVLLKANPLEDLTHVQDPAGVMALGQWWPEKSLQEGLKKIANKHQD